MAEVESISNQEVLTRVIDKAIANGMPFDRSWRVSSDGSGVIIELVNSPAMLHAIRYSTEQIIFNHRFCKALFGENEITISDLDNIYPGDYAATSATWEGPAWRYHLQQLAIAEDRIAYLKENAGIGQ